MLKDLVFWEDVGGKLTAVRCVLILAETFEVIPVRGAILPNNICIRYFHALRPIRRRGVDFVSFCAIPCIRAD